MNHLLCGLAANDALPSELVDRLIAVADTDIAAALAGRADLSRRQAVALVSRVEESAGRLAHEGRLTAADIDPTTQPLAALALLEEGAGRPEWARRLAAEPSAERRARLAACSGLPPDVTETLAGDTEVRVVAELARWTTPDVAAGLASHPHAEVRRAVAANEATPPEVLAALITGSGLPPAQRCLVCDREETPYTHDPHCPRLDCDLRSGASCDGSHESTLHDIRQAALGNPAAPAETVGALADHPSSLLRQDLAARPDLPSEVYARLAVDAIPGVRANVAANPAIDDVLIRVLAADGSHDVRRALAHHPHLPLDVLADLASTTRIGATLLPRIAAASPDEVEALAASRNPALRMLLAQRRDLPPGTRDTLAADPDAKVARSIAAHPGLSEAQLRSLVERYGGGVVARVATNPDTPPALLEELTRHEPPAGKTLREVARHRRATSGALLACLTDSRARRIAAGHPALPPQVVVELLTDADGEVAEAAAANPSLPCAAMAGLVP
ncbi:hypothetical protein AB0D99_16960 [Streptomyces sp. NPDC047971]|uniref:hypothetical protein n=1 Tax=Streptomyces sp. NPDC047971 TaxID=3154499 RepID=UPI0033F5771D